MFRSRFWMLIGVVGLMLGPLLGTAGFGLYLRSGMYADGVARRVSTFLGAPVQIGAAFPLDATSQGFRDVVVWLPGELYPIFYCDQAVLHIGLDKTIELELRDGQILAETDTWNQRTVAELLQTAFAHDFHQARMASIKLVGMDITLRRGPAMLRAHGATGRIDLSREAGRIDILCDGLNDQKAGEPVAIRCRFQPGNRPLIDELSLTVKQLPVAALVAATNSGHGDTETQRYADAETRRHGEGATGIPGATTVPAASQPFEGTVSGTVVYRQKDRDSTAGRIEFAGDVDRVDLDALGSRKQDKKWLTGTVSGSVSKAIVDGGQLQSLQGRVHVENVQLAGLLVRAGQPKVNGLLAFDVHELQYENNQIKALLAAGQVRDVDLEPVLRAWCGGTITGRLSADVEKVKILDGNLEEMTGQVRMVPPADGAGTIDRAVLETAVQKILNVDVPPVLADSIGYADLGARLHVMDNDLFIEGIAGPEEKYLLVGDFSSVAVPLVAQPMGPLPLEPVRMAVEAKIRSMAAGLRRESGK